MAETTPGPLILVLQFVGFMAAFRNPGTLGTMLAGLLTTWVTFTPCFPWIFLGAPFVEALRDNESLNAALSALTAAVVGVRAQPSPSGSPFTASLPKSSPCAPWGSPSTRRSCAASTSGRLL